MPTRTVFIDVDLTLVNLDGDLLLSVEDRLKEMKFRGYELVCWSHGGKEYAEALLDRHHIRKYFSSVLDKPDWIIDDDPEGIHAWADVLRVSGDDFWEKNSFWKSIFHKQVY